MCATPLDIAPPLGLQTLNFWSQIAFALTGLELLGMMGGEIKNPEKTIARAGNTTVSVRLANCDD